ncbi:MAG TPA: ribonuclease Z [Nitrososphaerales archaeon]|nr:ribonuclease Z [Nitrososphaerales archaeon]
MVKLTVTFLGTSSAAPSKSRGLPAIAVQREGDLIIMDCGEGVQRQVLAQGLGLNRETTVLITHLHGDHVTGLLGLLQTMSLAHRTKELTVVAPPALLEWLRVTSELLHIGLTFRIRFVAARRGTVLRTKHFDVRATRAEHSVEAYCFLIREHDRPGVFFPEKATRLGVPEGKLWSRLQKGRRVKVGRRTVSPSQVMGSLRHGRTIGYSGDTRPSKRLARFFAGVDLLIFDSTFSSQDSDKALERKHSTCVEAAELAKSARAKQLVLTHFSARYRSVTSLAKDARAVFPPTVAAFDGLRIDVDYPS